VLVLLVHAAQAMVTEPSCRLVRVLVTTRETLGLTGTAVNAFSERPVSALTPETACHMVTSVVQDSLSAEDVTTVATACRCVPLYLQLVSEALVTGRMRLEVGELHCATSPSSCPLARASWHLPDCCAAMLTLLS
jgi:hypothetical protein